jgi:large subunit ribosomal protein L15
MLKLNDLVNNPGSKKKYKRLGRGIGSGKGKTCARGGKGQTARSGVALRWFEGGQTPLIRRVPKRGFVGKSKKLIVAVNLYQIEKIILATGKKNVCVNNALLVQYGIIRDVSYSVKLLSYSYSEKMDLAGVKFSLDSYSAKALSCISESGGVVQNI